jgi:hypothetical protein
MGIGIATAACHVGAGGSAYVCSHLLVAER